MKPGVAGSSLTKIQRSGAVGLRSSAADTLPSLEARESGAACFSAACAPLVAEGGDAGVAGADAVPGGIWRPALRAVVSSSAARRRLPIVATLALASILAKR